MTLAVTERAPEEVPPLCVLAAMRREVAPLLAQLRPQQSSVFDGAKYKELKTPQVSGMRFGALPGLGACDTPVLVVWFGMGARAACHAAEWLAEQRHAKRVGASALLVGIAGGLDPALREGDVVCIERVLSAQQPEREALAGCGAALRSAHRCGTAVSSSAIVASVEAKRELWQRCGTPANAVVDLESFAFISRLQERSSCVSVSVVRVVSDAAHHELPPALAAASGPQGLQLASLLLAGMRGPALWPQLWRLRQQTGRAAGALCRAVRDHAEQLLVGRGGPN